MQLTFPRFTGQALVNFARQVADILDLKSVAIDDKTDGAAGFGNGEIKPPEFTFEAQDGASITIKPQLGSELNPLLSSRYIAAELDRKRRTNQTPQQGAASASDDIWSDRDGTKDAKPKPPG